MTVSYLTVQSACSYWKVFLRKDKANWGNQKCKSFFFYIFIVSDSSFPITSLPVFFLFLAVHRDFGAKGEWWGWSQAGSRYQGLRPQAARIPKRCTHIPRHCGRCVAGQRKKTSQAEAHERDKSSQNLETVVCSHFLILTPVMNSEQHSAHRFHWPRHTALVKR